MRGPAGTAEPGSREGEGSGVGQTGLITGLALDAAPGNLLLGLGGCLQLILLRLSLLQMELGDGCGDGCWIQGSLLPRGKWCEEQPIPSMGKAFGQADGNIALQQTGLLSGGSNRSGSSLPGPWQELRSRRPRKGRWLGKITK